MEHQAPATVDKDPDRLADMPRHATTAERSTPEARTQPEAGRQAGEGDARDSAAPPRRRRLIAVGAGLLVLIAIAAGVYWWLDVRGYESTDDAFIAARSVPIAAQVGGLIVNVPVTDNQVVQAGAILVQLDSRDYSAALSEAKAKVEQAQADIATSEAQYASQQASIEQARNQVVQDEAALQLSRQQNARAQQLLKNGAGPQQTAQQTISDLAQKQAALQGAHAAVTVAEKQLAVLDAQRRSAAAALGQAEAAETQAETNLSRTVIRAPIDGRVTNRSGAKGAYAQVGQSLMMFVPRAVWVFANFKETQLMDMRPGQPVDISIDAYPDHTFRGRVDSVQAGSGTAFSLLPAENATGNFVKVVQRVPVKITFDRPPDVLLGPGMSVVATVKVK